MSGFDKPWGTRIEFSLRFPLEMLGGAATGMLLLSLPPLRGLPLRSDSLPSLLAALACTFFLFSLLLMAEWASATEGWWRAAAVSKSVVVGGICSLCGMTGAALVGGRQT